MRSNGQVWRTSTGWRYRVQWRDDAGERRSKGAGRFATKQAAQAAMRKVQTEVHEGTHITPHGTVGEFLRGWLDFYEKSGTVKPGTAFTVRENVTKHIIPRLGSIPLAKLSPEHIAKFYADLLAGGGVRHKGRALSPKTVRNISSHLRRALSDAVEWGRVSRNVASNVRLPRWEKPDLAVWDSSQIGQFLRHTTTSGDYLAPIWRLLLVTGLRRGEVLGLRWNDLDSVEGTVTVVQTRIEIGGKTVTQSPKTNRSRRTVSIDGETVYALNMMRDAQDRAAAKLGGWHSDLICTALDGQPIEPEALTRKFQQTARAAGFEIVPRLHDLRHSSATLQLSQGVPVHVVAGRLGHSTPATTLNVYAKFLPQADKLAADAIGYAITEQLGAKPGANIEQLTETNNTETA